MSDDEEEHKKLHDKKSEELKQSEDELKDLQSRAEEQQKRFREAEAQIVSLAKQKAELEDAVQETKKEAEVKYCTKKLSFTYVPILCICSVLN